MRQSLELKNFSANYSRVNGRIKDIMTTFEFLVLNIFFLIFSGLFMVLGCYEHKEAVQLMENLSDFILGAAKNEGTD